MFGEFYLLPAVQRCSKHISGIVQTWIVCNVLKQLHYPQQSFDLNLIEHFPDFPLGKEDPAAQNIKKKTRLTLSCH